MDLSGLLESESAALEYAPIVGNEVFPNDTVFDLKSKLGTYEFDLRTIDSKIQSTIAKSGSDVLECLEKALQEICIACIVVSEDFEHSIKSDFTDSYLSSSSRRFDSCEKAAEEGSKTLDELSTQTASLEAGALVELNRRTSALGNEFARDEEAIRARTIRAELDRQKWLEQYQEAQTAWRKAKDEEDSIGRKIGDFFEDVGDFLLGDTRGMVSRVLAEADKMRELHRVLEQSNAFYHEADRDLQQLTSQLALLEINRRKLSTLALSTKALGRQASTMMNSFVTLKNNATTLLREVNSIQNSARMIKMAYSKDAFVEDILRLCQRSLFDRRVCHQVARIVRKMEAQYNVSKPPTAAISVLFQKIRDVLFIYNNTEK